MINTKTENRRLVYRRFCIVVTVFIVLIQVSVSRPVAAEVAGPGWFAGTAEPISPEKSRSYYKNKTSSPKNKKTLSTFTTTEAMVSVSSAVVITPEITELARALHYVPKLIYDHVYNKIDYVPYFGSLKGATQTLLDESGNDFDQASLMIALLRASGYTADYVHGTKSISHTRLEEWIGIDRLPFDVLGIAAGVYGSNGVPVTIDPFNWALIVERVWVKATINGTDYLFDPSDKRYTNKSKIDIRSATGYNRTDLLTAATTGATINSNSVQNLNQANLNNKLTEYTTNLVNTLRSQYPNSDVRDIIGGRQIIQILETYLTQYSTTLPDVKSVLDEWTDIPASYIATMRIQHQGIDYTFEIPEITGKRLTITYAGSSFIPELRLDGTLIASGNTTTQGTRYDMIVFIDHPYASGNGTYMDQTATFSCVSGSTYAIVSDFVGENKDNSIRKCQKELIINLANGLSDTSEQVLGETLNIMGLTWIKETHLANYLLNMVTDTIFIRHHSIGLMVQQTGYFIDAKMNYYGVADKRPSGSGNWVPSFKTKVIDSALEHAMLEQLMGSDKPGVSTIKLMQIANSQGSKVFWADSGNFASIQPQLYNYSSQTLSEIQGYINSGRIVILPDNGQLSINQWRGAGYAAINMNNASYSMQISGGYFGGYGSIPGYVEPAPIYENVWITLPDISYDLEIPTITSSEPVDMASGAYLYDRTDIALGGSAPMGLEFHRSYNSSRNREKRSMDYGWQHNHDIFLNRVSDGNPGLGLRKPVDVAAMITNLYIADDLMRNEDNITGWMVMFLAHKWAVDKLIDNVISVNIGGQVTEYVKLSDGSYNNPPGITIKLVDNGNGTFSLKERFGKQMDFDVNDRIVQLKDVDGNTLNFTYLGNKLTSVQDAVGRTLTLNYTGDNLTSVMDSAGRSVTYSYDGNNNLVSYTDVAGKSWIYGYDAEHQMTSLTNPLGITTANNTYDSLDRVKTQTVPRDGATTATYNFYFSGFRNVEEDPFGKRTAYYLDEKGRTYAVEDALLNKTVKTFDGQNHALTIKDARTNTTTFTYDGNQNLTKITNALSKDTTNTYDAQFRLTDIIDPLNHTTHFDYDSEHHLTLTTVRPTDTETITTSLTYYPNGQTQAATDGRGTVTTFTYDSKNHPLTTKTALHPQITYNYDAIGRMLSLTDQEGVTTNFTYDNRGLVLTRTDPLGKAASFIYDDAGRMISRTDRNNNTTTYTYTPSDKLKNITYPDLSTVTFTYDLHDKLINMQDAAGITTYTYDSVYRLKSVTNPYGKVVSYEYDKVGNVTKIIYPGNKAVTYTYDNLNRLKTVTNWLSQTATYNYDDAGRLTDVINFNGTINNYAYDNTNRMTSLQNKTSSTGIILSGYSYTLDGNGNKVQVTQTELLAPITPIGLKDFTYNPTKNRLLSVGLTNFTYDNEGQLTTKDTASYSFDYEHRLKSISGTDLLQFLYDGKGNRLQASRNSIVTRYIYDALGNLLAETDATNVITKYYIYGKGLLAMVDQSGQTYTYHHNGIGSTIAMTDQNKNVVNKYSYTPFGLITNQEEQIPQPFKFVGQQGVMTEQNGFYYMRARYYDPSIGRFISEDPIGFEGGINLYAYANNNPINLIDPLGLEAGGAGSFVWDNFIGPVYNTLTQPGYNYGMWVYGEKNFGNFVGACLDSVWAITGVYGGIQAVAANGAPYWQYYPADNPAYQSPWLTRGRQQPYATGEEAYGALKLPDYNPGTAVREVNVPWWEPVAGPRRVGGGTGWEYFRDSFLFPKK